MQYLLCKLKGDERRRDVLKNTESINVAFWCSIKKNQTSVSA